LVEEIGRRIRRPKNPTPARYKWVNPWMVAKSDAVRRLADDTRHTIDAFEEAHTPRRWARLRPISKVARIS